MSGEAYAFPTLPLSPVPAGTSVLVEGPYHGGTREVGFRMLGSESGEGQVIVSTNNTAAQLAREQTSLGLDFDQDRTAIIDCVGGQGTDLSARQFSVSSARDLTGITMRLSKAYQELFNASCERVRMGIVSVSSLLTVGEVRSVFRFVSTIAGRIANLDGLGVFVVNPAIHDTRTIETIAQFMHGRIQVREQDGTRELRTSGVAGQPSGWQEVDSVTDSESDCQQ